MALPHYGTRSWAGWTTQRPSRSGFVHKADRQTYVWLYGEGQNSKGAILRALERTFGSAYKADEVPANRDKFWSYWLQGKRLVAFGDTNDAGFPASGFFKSLTGGDSVRMEIKGGASFCAALTAMFIFASNERPALSSEKADLRRVILCELRPIIGEPLMGYEDGLWAEMPSFVARCMRAHEVYGGGAIASDSESIDQWVGLLEDKYSVVVSDEFVLYDPSIYERREKTPYVDPGMMTKFVHKAFKTTSDIRNFYKYLERKHKIKRSTVKLSNGSTEARFVGINFKEPHMWNVRNKDA